MAFRSVGTGTNGNNTAPTTNAPAGVTSGDIVVQFLFTNNAATTVNWASGFTEFATIEGTAPNRDNGAYQLHCAWKLATGSEPGTYINGLVGGSDFWQGFAACWSGRNTVSPVTASATTNASGTVSPVTYALAGVTAAAGDDVAWFPSSNGTVTGTAAWTPPTNYSSRISYQPGAAPPAQNLSTRDSVSAGATGTLSGTETGTDGDKVGIVFSLAAASASLAKFNACMARNNSAGF